MADYPKTKYPLRGGGSITVTSAAHEKQLGSDWTDQKPEEVPRPVEIVKVQDKKNVRRIA